MKDKELLQIFIKNGKRETIAIHNKDVNPHLLKKIIERNNLEVKR